MSLKHRLSDPELTQLQAIMLGEPMLPSDIEDPAALVSLLGRGLVRQEHGRYWPDWDLIAKNSV